MEQPLTTKAIDEMWRNYREEMQRDRDDAIFLAEAMQKYIDSLIEHHAEKNTDFS